MAFYEKDVKIWWTKVAKIVIFNDDTHFIPLQRTPANIRINLILLLKLEYLDYISVISVTLNGELWKTCM